MIINQITFVMLIRNLAFVGAGQALALSITLYNAYNLKGQFYPACVYLLRSGLSVIV